MNQNNDKILLVGDISKAFLDKAVIANSNCNNCATITQAIEAIKNNSYSAIAIVMLGLQTKLNPAIKTLRDNSSARIVLLAQMYEEPIAIRLMYSSYKDKPLIDDYMICPVDVDNFLSSEFRVLSPEKQPSEPGTGYSELNKNSLLSTQNELSARIRHLEKLATEDDLTGLKNRRYIMEFTRQIIEYAQEENGRVTLLVFDIDDFKKYNDQYGHMAGDEILKQAAHLMQRCCRPHDVVGRIGGDEFAVVFWDDPSILKTVIEQSKVNDRRSIDSDHPNEAMIIAKRFVSELEKTPAPIANQNTTEHNCARAGLGPKGIGILTISGGLASYPRDGKSVKELFEQADNALLEAKRNGKNRIFLVGKPQS
ncbi:MAG: GGDEF domain-containing protein [Sedimentisphaerales bacterium]|nr:GGDEF domain-containing protein [Sedimentisphaerales bacterium]